jgi:hypothetical protein
MKIIAIDRSCSHKGPEGKHGLERATADIEDSAKKGYQSKSIRTLTTL